MNFLCGSGKTLLRFKNELHKNNEKIKNLLQSSPPSVRKNPVELN